MIASDLEKLQKRVSKLKKENKDLKDLIYEIMEYESSVLRMDPETHKKLEKFEEKYGEKQ